MNIPFRKDQHDHHHGSFDHHITAERNTLGSSSYMSDGAGLLSSSFSNASDLSSSSIGSYNSVNSTNSSLLSTSTAATGWMGMSPPNYVMGFNGGNHSSSSPQPNGYHHTKSQSMNSANNNMTTWLSSSGGNHHHSQQHPNNTIPQQDHHQHFGTSLLSNSHHHQLGTHQRRITTGSSSFDFSSSMDDISLMGHNSSVRGRSAATSTFNSVFGPTQTNSVPTELEIPSRTSVCSNNVMTNMAEEHVDPTMLLLDSPKVGHNHSRSQHLSHDDGINVNMFVRSVVGKVLSDDMEEFNSFHHVSGQQNHHHHHHNYQQQPALNNHLNISPQPSSPLSRRFMSMSCPTVLNSFQNSIGFQLFQQQQQHPLQHDSHNETNNSSVSSIDFDLIESVIAGDESTSDHTLQGKKPCKYFFSAEGCTYGGMGKKYEGNCKNTRKF
ncbi:hypothetical protein C9374_012110 [Naegleria lovaniensis]|uniref:Uncharacterized protein n=1 Tax=Naegleria lovaniensis TaxID=51637 RepID=A0AA88KCR1_NAELO|nr:uncharacterized protein C9374_012110 [Naegleria lovaniensis]KAG2373503.1 hypothetical protein C9374_012110 [Naegleria lovaniensis]